MRLSRAAAGVTIAAILSVGIPHPAQAAPDYADVLARTIDRTPPAAQRTDPWAVAIDEATPRPIDGWGRADVISPAREAALILARIREQERAEARRAAREQAALAASSARYSAQPVGGSFWDAIAECEGSSNWALVTTGNGYWWVLQFSAGTWLANGGTQAELDAGVAPSRARLIEVAENVLASQGPGAWPNCP